LFCFQKLLSYICTMNNSMINFAGGHSFYFDRVHLHPDEQIGLHKQYTWELSYIITGSGTCQLGDSVSHFSGGEVVLVPPELPHCWTFDKEDVDTEGMIENITLVFNTDLFSRLASSFIEIHDQMESLATIDSALQFTKEDAADAKTILNEMTIQTEAARLANLIRLLVTISENLGSAKKLGSTHCLSLTEKRLKDIETYVNCNFKREITLDMIARYVGMNRSSFCSFFVKSKGMTFFRYLNSYRMDVVCDLLCRNTGGIAEICYQSGFRDIPYFNRMFKQYKGMTPSEYRKTCGDISAQ
jgi:AraC-like DNA-binding protein